MIQNISIDMIKPHPNNPRKDLGDLTELADSIRERGILQNLTVVPDHDYYNSDTKEFEQYIVIIGHRRLAAAKLAGLREVPAAVIEMDKRTQIATMLLENIQRVDLTVMEQAKGFQMMIDFGETVKGIAEKTGFSETTIRHRVRLNELNSEKFAEAVARGGRLEDYIALEKISNPKLKNKVLETVGTRDFQWTLNNALEEEAMPQRKKELLEFLKDWAKHVKSAPNNSSYEHNFYRYKLDNFKKPKDAGKTEYYYVDSGNGTTLYKKTAAPEKKQKSDSEKSFKEREAKIKELSKRAYELRRQFVLNFSGGKKQAEGVMAFTMVRLIRYGGSDTDELLKLLEIEVPKDEGKGYMEMVNLKRDLILKEFAFYPERVMLIIAWATIDNHEKYYSSRSYDYSIVHEPNATLDAIYDGLIALGYEMSEEEQQLRDGTHELFTVKEE